MRLTAVSARRDDLCRRYDADDRDDAAIHLYLRRLKVDAGYFAERRSHGRDERGIVDVSDHALGFESGFGFAEFSGVESSIPIPIEAPQVRDECGVVFQFLGERKPS